MSFVYFGLLFLGFGQYHANKNDAHGGNCRDDYPLRVRGVLTRYGNYFFCKSGYCRRSDAYRHQSRQNYGDHSCPYSSLLHFYHPFVRALFYAENFFD